MKDAPRILIIGGGFGGVYAYLQLRATLGSAAKITVINATDHFLFTPMLHEVATGGLGQESVVERWSEITGAGGHDFVQATLQRIDLTRRVAYTTAGEIGYDYVVLALGAMTNYYGISGAAEYTLPMKTLADAAVLREKIIVQARKAGEAMTRADAEAALAVTVVGGGATGVELATELAELFVDLRKHGVFRKAGGASPQITLLTADSELLTQFHDRARHHAEEVLRQRLVAVTCNAKVVGVDPDGVRLADGSKLMAGLVLWTAGVKANTPLCDPAVELDKWGRVCTDQYLRARGYENVFAVGDVASVTGEDGRPLPMFAQVAVRAGRVAGANIAAAITGKPLREFAYHSMGNFVSLGSWKAVGELKDLAVSGSFAWWLRRTAYILRFATWSKRFFIFGDWTLRAFRKRDIYSKIK